MRPRCCKKNGGGPDQMHSLEVSAERQLQVANIARLTGNLPKGTAGRVQIHAAPIGVIERGECLGEELKASSLVDREFFEHLKIPAAESGTVDFVASPLLVLE